MFLLSLLQILFTSFLASDAFPSPRLQPPPHQTKRRSTTSLLASSSSSSTDEPLSVAIVGAGPSGLLLAHRLCQAGKFKVSVYEKRPRPTNTVTSQQRAYALGVGRRGRTAIQSVDADLWKAVKTEGFASERFDLHVGPFQVRLRDEKDGRGVEPSLLLYQSDLCRVLTDELERRYDNNASNRLSLQFDCKVVDLNLQAQQLTTSKATNRFDLVVGCDGVNSVVRPAIAKQWSDFQTTQEVLPGEFKVALLPGMPPKLDATAVALLLPKGGAVTAFVEPTSKERCCLLFAGRSSNDTAPDPLLVSENTTELQELIEERFPKLQGADLETAAEQLAGKKTSMASLVKCNIFHYGNVAALTGDAAHATGGVSGQGVNSALVDSAVLADKLIHYCVNDDKSSSIRQALLEYSQQQVPEAQALYDLSFGPRPQSKIKRIKFGIKTILDSVFKGRLGIGDLPLQTKLTTSAQSFSDIRRERDAYYDEPFPDGAYWNQSLAELDAKA